MSTVSIQKYAENIQLSEDTFKNSTFPTTTLFSPVYKFKLISGYNSSVPALPYPVQCDTKNFREWLNIFFNIFLLLVMIKY